MKVIVGNHMVMAARGLGWPELWVEFVDDDDVKAIRRGLADNATGDLATWDDQILAELLAETGPVPGIDDQMVEELEHSISSAVAGSVEATDRVPYPIVPRWNEQYDYVLIVADNPIDVAWLHTKFQLRREQSFKSLEKGVARVVSVARAQELLDGNPYEPVVGVDPVTSHPVTEHIEMPILEDPI